MEFYVGKQGKKLGPFNSYTLRERLADETISADDLGWTRGMNEWMPLREISSLKPIIDDFERRSDDSEKDQSEPGLDAPTAEELGYPNRPEREEDFPPMVGGTPQSGAAMTATREEAVATRVYPFRRFLARIFDYTLVHLATFAIFKPVVFSSQLSIAENQKIFSDYIASPEGLKFQLILVAALFVWAPIEGLLLSMFGTTPGKAVFGIYVTDSRENHPGWWTAFARSLAVWLMGYGAGIQWISPPLMLFAFFQLLTKGSVFWDRYYNTSVVLRPFSATRLMLALFLFLSLIGLSQLATFSE